MTKVDKITLTVWGIIALALILTAIIGRLV